MLRPIIEYSNFKGFYPLKQLGEMIHSNLVIKFCIIFHFFKCAPIIGKIHVNHSKCENVIENIQVHIYPFFLFEILDKFE
jgi:hypothetical protein